MLCQQNLISQHKYMVITQQKYVISTKNLDKSVKWADSAKIRWLSKICCVSKIYGSVKMPGDDSAKTCCISKNYHLRFENGKRRKKKYVISTKNLDKSVKWADSAKIRWVSKICCVSKIYGSVKMPGDDSAKTCCISKNCHLRFENGKRRNRCL